MSDSSAAKLRTRVRAGLAIVLLVLLGIAIIAYRATYQILGTQQQSVHSRALLLQIQKTVSDVTEAETSQRGYLYTGKEDYLRPYAGAQKSASEELAALLSATANDVEGHADSLRLQDLVQLKMQELQRTIDLYKSGQTTAARNLVLEGEGIELMGQIRALAQKMYERESELAETRLEQSARSASEAGIAFALAAAMAAALVLVLGFSITRDLTKRERAEIAEREARQEAGAAHEQNRQIVESITEGFAAVDHHGRVTYLNYQAAKLAGKTSDEALGQEISGVFPQLLGSALEEAWRRAMEERTTSTAEAYFDGPGRWLEIVAYPGSEQGITILLRDVTDRHRRDEALMKAEKLAAAGRLSAGIAHEINNPLEAITNLLYIARNNPERTQDCIRMAEQELARVAHITRQTLGFYRDVSSYAVVDLRAIVDEVLDLFSRKLKLKEIHVRKEFVRNVTVLGQSGEIRQVLANLVANSIDALAKGGTLAIRVSEHYEWSDGNRPGVRITLADNGCGIAAEQYDKIFEPFYTTKQDTGTGLGLWLSQTILDKHGGSLHFRSSTHPKNRGTTFSIFLPKKAEEVFPGESIPELRKKPA
jgi:PAS domain S-box-containing protein